MRVILLLVLLQLFPTCGPRAYNPPPAVCPALRIGYEPTDDVQPVEVEQSEWPPKCFFSQGAPCWVFVAKAKMPDGRPYWISQFCRGVGWHVLEVAGQRTGDP